MREKVIINKLRMVLHIFRSNQVARRYDNNNNSSIAIAKKAAARNVYFAKSKPFRGALNSSPRSVFSRAREKNNAKADFSLYIPRERAAPKRIYGTNEERVNNL